MHKKYRRIFRIPDGTKFYVKNGHWRGQLVLIDGVKHIKVFETDRTYKLTPDTILNIITEESEKKRDAAYKIRYNKTTFLYNADPNCEHDIQPQWGGGVKCEKCTGWFCY